MPKTPTPGANPQSPRKGGSRTRRELDLLLPMVMAICIVLGWFVVLDYERAAGSLSVLAPALGVRVGLLRLMMALLSVGSLGLAWLAARDARRRRQAEHELKLANLELARRVAQRTAELSARTKALHESRLRERLREKEAEVAFQAGLVEAAGQYLHGVGNALSALDVELLRLSRIIDGADRLGAAFDAVLRDAGETGDAAAALEPLRAVVLDRIFPRLAAALGSLREIKEGMAGDLERGRGAFERRGKPSRYLQSIRVDLELADILDRLPRATGSDPVVRDIAAGVAVRNRKHPLLTGVAALLRQALDTAPGRVAVRLAQVPGERAVLRVEGVRPDVADHPEVAAFINFLNENNGAFRLDPPGSPGVADPPHPGRLELEIGDALAGDGHIQAPGPSDPIAPDLS